MQNIQKNIFLAPYTAFKLGGPAKYFAEARGINDVRVLCKWAKKEQVPVFVMGNGSNLLVSDKGFGGLVIKIGAPDDHAVRFWPTGSMNFKIAEVWAGFFLPELFYKSAGSGLSGLEWAAGLRNSVGGALRSNVGARGSRMSDIVDAVWVLDLDNLKVFQMLKDECGFGYRDSIFKKNPRLVVLSASFIFRKKPENETVESAKNIIAKRAAAQPVGQKSAGYFFKNIEWKRGDVDRENLLKRFSDFKKFAHKSEIPAGFLIDSLGFKGKRIGNAEVSEKHANFILNKGGAKAEHVIMLASAIKDRVYSHYGLMLEPEVELLGF